MIKTEIEPLCLEIINLDNLNKDEKFSEKLDLNSNKNKKNKNSRNNNFIKTTDKTRRNIDNINQKSKISCWFCCGVDSVDVI